MSKLSDAILEVLLTGGKFQEPGKAAFEAITETDLMAGLRERGWKLPPAGYFLGEVRDAGFKVTQGQHFPNKVHRTYDDGSKGRTLAAFQTIIYL
ncbi:hypothetical protein EVC26_023 [Rhizobium phage RHph_I72]|nr:hypothetical protein EVC26_023 [Rhizobium phage RHph_I72]